MVIEIVVQIDHLACLNWTVSIIDCSDAYSLLRVQEPGNGVALLAVLQLTRNRPSPYCANEYGVYDVNNSTLE